MRHRGFTLFELLIALTVIAVLLGVGVPGFSAVIEKSRTKTATYALIDAIQSARALAVHSNGRAVLRATNGEWHEGWELFRDVNHDGEIGEGESVVSTTGRLPGVRITANTHVKEYISFVGTGAGRKLGNGEEGAFQVGTIKVCPTGGGDGYSLVLSVGGRTRIKEIDSTDCEDI